MHCNRAQPFPGLQLCYLCSLNLYKEHVYIGLMQIWANSSPVSTEMNEHANLLLCFGGIAPGIAWFPVATDIFQILQSVGFRRFVPLGCSKKHLGRQVGSLECLGSIIISVSAVVCLEKWVPLKSYNELSKQNNPIAYNNHSTEFLCISAAAEIKHGHCWKDFRETEWDVKTGTKHGVQNHLWGNSERQEYFWISAELQDLS